ncbi:MAG: hypothetical protein LQ339_007732 [Xanthoria mediterranea]|nr:MAG: hypothetical protein LQ339_007732 [Xanthoria mediterranea]
MRELALMDFEGDLIEPGARTYAHPDYPGATALVSPAAGIAHASIRFAIWTLYETMRDTLRIPICGRTYYVGTWEGRDIVHVKILQQPPLTATQNKTVDTQLAQIAGTKIALPSVSTNGSFSFETIGLSRMANVGDSDLHAEITYRGKTMNQRDISMTAFGIMLRLAPTNRQDLGVFKSIDITITTEVVSIFNRAARSIPYVMSSGDLIAFVAYLPEHLLREKKWQEMDIALTDKQFPEVVIARGSIRVGRPVGPPVNSMTKIFEES